MRALMTYGAPLSASQLARESGLTPQGTRLVLNSLVSQQLITVLGQPRAQLFTIDVRHPFADALKALFVLEQSRWDDLLHALRTTLQKHKSVKAAWYYGSVARGEDEPRSDLDIAIVVADEPVEDAVESVREALHSVEDALLVSCSVVALSQADVARLSADDVWWREMARDAKVLKGVGPEQVASRSRRVRQTA